MHKNLHKLAWVVLALFLGQVAPKITSTGSGKRCSQMLIVFHVRTPVEGRNPQGLKEGKWIERESCSVASLLDAFSSSKCGFELLVVRHVLVPSHRGAAAQ